MATLSNRHLSSLIALVYDCALSPDLWGETLRQLGDLLQCARVILSVNDLRHSRILIGRSVGWEANWLAERARHASEIHDRTSEWFARTTSLDLPFVASRDLQPAYLHTSPYANECLGPLGVVDVMHMFLKYTPSEFAEIVLTRQEEKGLFSEHEIELSQLLLPHIRRAVNISSVLDARAIEQAQMTETLNGLRQGIVLVAGTGAIVYANKAASDMFRAGGPIRDVRGILGAVTPAASMEIRQAVAIAGEDEGRIGKIGACILVSEPDMAPVFAHVLPMKGSNMRSEFAPSAAAAIFVSAGPDELGTAKAMASAFRLTHSETRVLASLLLGRTLSETAKEHGTAITTTKSHLDNIFAKTGVSRQAALIRLAMQTF